MNINLDGNTVTNGYYGFSSEDPSVLIQGDENSRGWIKLAPQDLNRDSLAAHKGVYAMRADDLGHNTYQGFVFINPDLGTDEKMWFLMASPYGHGGQMQFVCSNDAESETHTAMILDRAGTIPLPVQFPYGANLAGTPPASPHAGDMYFNGSALKIYISGTWKTVQVV